MLKNYVVFYDANNFYFPVKARFNPYKARPTEWYCGGYPQFFGGGSNPGEGIVTCLKREVCEESIKTCELGEDDVTALYEGTHGRDVYDFYCTNNWKFSGIPWPNADIWKSNRKPAAKEMCWVAQASKAGFIALTAPSRENIANFLMQAARTNPVNGTAPPDYARTQMAVSISEDFKESHTLQAFEAFWGRLVNNTLPRCL